MPPVSEKVFDHNVIEHIIFFFFIIHCGGVRCYQRYSGGVRCYQLNSGGVRYYQLYSGGVRYYQLYSGRVRLVIDKYFKL